MRKIATILLGMILTAAMCPAQISLFPHFVDFEDEFQCPVGCIPVCNLQGPWENVSGDDFDWTSDKGGTGTGGTGPATDHTFGSKTGHYLYIESSCNNLGYPSKRVDLQSGYYDFTNITGAQLKLSAWYHMYGANMGDLHFDVDTTQGQGNWINNFVPLWTDNLNQWQRKEIDLSALIGIDSVKFRIRCVTGNLYRSDMALDDIMVYEPSVVDVGVTDILINPLQWT